jgi:hypothetical protein
MKTEECFMKFVIFALVLSGFMGVNTASACNAGQNLNGVRLHSDTNGSQAQSERPAAVRSGKTRR